MIKKHKKSHKQNKMKVILKQIKISLLEKNLTSLKTIKK